MNNAGVPGRARLASHLALQAALRRLCLPVPATLAGYSIADPRKAVDVDGPWFVKGVSEHYPHKSEHGLVMGPLTTADELRSTCEALDERLRALDPDGAVIVQQAIESVFEWLISYTFDPWLGPFVHLGAGGAFVELIDDVVTVSSPVDEPGFIRMLGRLRHGKVAYGYRALVPDHREELFSVVRRLTSANLRDAFGTHVLALELNPVAVTSSGTLTVLDAVAVVDSDTDTLRISAGTESEISDG